MTTGFLFPLLQSLSSTLSVTAEEQFVPVTPGSSSAPTRTSCGFDFFLLFSELLPGNLTKHPEELKDPKMLQAERVLKP